VLTLPSLCNHASYARTYRRAGRPMLPPWWPCVRLERVRLNLGHVEQIVRQADEADHSAFDVLWCYVAYLLHKTN
jgi:hypothetical protein